MREVTYNHLYASYDRKTQQAIQRKLLRQIQIRNQILFIMVLSFTVLIIVFMMAGFGSQASTEDNVEYKYFKSIEIQRGDSLWSIAEDYNNSTQTSTSDYVKDIKEMNNLPGNTIKAGQKLIVPYYSHEFISKNVD